MARLENGGTAAPNVAQTGSLLYRRLATCGRVTAGRLPVGDTADYQSALRLVIGGRDMEAGAVSVRLHHGGPQGAKPKGEVVADILVGSKDRRA